MIEVMSQAIDILALYLHLARASELRRRPHVHDRLLVLAGVVAARMPLPRIAAYCRHKVLEHNPRHAVGRWPRLAEALEDPDFQSLLRTLQRRYPLEKAESLLANLGLERGRERATYYTDEEYAAALLGVRLEILAQMFGDV
jgi:hypothetical protein